MTHPLAYIRVAIASEPDRNGMVKCLTVNEAGFDPKYLVAHRDAITPAPIEREVENIQLSYGGKPYNRVKGK